MKQSTSVLPSYENLEQITDHSKTFLKYGQEESSTPHDSLPAQTSTSYRARAL